MKLTRRDRKMYLATFALTGTVTVIAFALAFTACVLVGAPGWIAPLVSIAAAKLTNKPVMRFTARRFLDAPRASGELK